MARKPKQPTWTKEEIRDMLVKSDNAVIRGLMTIYSYQTAEEQVSGIAIEDNGMGFNGCDADFLTKVAVNYKNFKRLSGPQIECTRKMMLKYAGQLARHANIHKPKAQCLIS